MPDGYIYKRRNLEPVYGVTQALQEEETQDIPRFEMMKTYNLGLQDIARGTREQNFSKPADPFTRNRDCLRYFR